MRPLLRILPFLLPLSAAPALGQHDHVHHGPLGHSFKDAARWAKEFDDPKRDAWQRPAEVVKALGDVAGRTVVDLGAGTGYFVGYLSRAVGEAGKVIAVDIEPDMVRYLGERIAKEGLKNATAKAAEVGDPGLAPASVDRVLTVDTWHHIPERTAYAKKLLAALKPGGMVCIVDFTLESKHGPPVHHRIKPEQVAKELGDAGLVAEIVKESLPDQYIVVGKRP